MTINEIQQYRKVTRDFLVDPLAELTLASRFAMRKLPTTTGRRSYAVLTITPFHRKRINDILFALQVRKTIIKQCRVKAAK